MVKLGFFVYGEYYEQSNPEEGHIEIAMRILEGRPTWLQSFKANDKYRDPVDFLIYTKGAVKIGNRWGAKVLSYNSRFLDKEMEGCICEYNSCGWILDDVALLYSY